MSSSFVNDQIKKDIAERSEVPDEQAGNAALQEMQDYLEGESSSGVTEEDEQEAVQPEGAEASAVNTDWLQPELLHLAESVGIDEETAASFEGAKQLATAIRVLVNQQRKQPTQQQEKVEEVEQVEAPFVFEIPKELSDEALDETYGESAAPFKAFVKLVKGQFESLKKLQDDELKPVKQMREQAVRGQQERDLKMFDGGFDELSKTDPSIAEVFGRGVFGRDQIPDSKLRLRSEAKEVFDLLRQMRPNANLSELFKSALDTVRPEKKQTKTQSRRIGQPATRVPPIPAPKQSREENLENVAKELEQYMATLS